MAVSSLCCEQLQCKLFQLQHLSIKKKNLKNHNSGCLSEAMLKT